MVAEWSGWQKVLGVICDKRVAAKVTGEVFKRVVRLTKGKELKILRFSLGGTTMDKFGMRTSD